MLKHDPDNSDSPNQKIRKYSCQYCGKKFPTPSHLRDHELIHSDKKEYKCMLCNKEFTLQRQLKNHTIVIHGDSKFICVLCGKKFATSGSLKLHGFRHSSKKPFQCSICNKGFINKLNLNDHISIHKNQKNYTCSICGNGYHCLSSLWLHNRTKHLGRKKHKCNMCGECFTFQRQLESHMFKHTGKKDFLCNICSKSFIRKESLKMHTRLHTGEKLHVCAACGKAFINAYKLNRHMNTHGVDVRFVMQRRSKNLQPTPLGQKGSVSTTLLVADPIIRPTEGKPEEKIVVAIKPCDIPETPASDHQITSQMLPVAITAPGIYQKVWQFPIGVDSLQSQCHFGYQTAAMTQWDSQATDSAQYVHVMNPLISCAPSTESNIMPAFHWVTPSSTPDTIAACMNASGIPTNDTCGATREQMPLDAHELLNQTTYHVQSTAPQVKGVAPVAHSFLQSTEVLPETPNVQTVPQVPSELDPPVVTVAATSIVTPVIPEIPHTIMQPLVTAPQISNASQVLTSRFITATQPTYTEVNRNTDIQSIVPKLPGTRYSILTSKATAKSPHADRIAQGVPNQGPNILAQTKNMLKEMAVAEPPPMITKDTKMFPCDFCIKLFVSQETLKKHLLAKHKKSRPFVCKFCKKTFIQPNHLKDHLLIHSKDNGNKCLRCDKVFTLQRQLQRHMILKHSNHVTVVPVSVSPGAEAEDQKPTCDICKRMFLVKSTLKKHMRAHDRSKCITCGKQFMNALELKAHIETTPSCEYRHKCDECNKSFESPCHLKSHMLRHTSDRPFVCETCGKRFFEAGTLKLHTYIHTNEKPYTCPICSKGFVNRLNLNDHVSIHTNEKRYVCPLCGNGYHCLSSLWLHNRTKHLGAKDHQCTLCGEQFTYARQLESHMFKHTGKKDYTCKTCGKAFIRAETLKMHTRLHTGEKLFECPICKKAFITAYKLRRHSSTHNEKRLFAL